MIDVTDFRALTTKFRIGVAFVTYYDITIACDICLYQQQKLWVRMPEIWVTKTLKRQFVYWEDRYKSDAFQHVVLKKVFDLVGLDLEKALEIQASFKPSKKNRQE